MRTLLLAFLGGVTVVAYLQRSALGVPSRQIERDLGLGPGGLGDVWFGWYAAYAAFQLPAAWLADRWGSKAALAVFAVGWSALTALSGLAGGYWGLLALWSLMGAAQAGVFPCATKAIRATFEKTRQAVASGVLACCMSGGAALAQAVTGLLVGALAAGPLLAVAAAGGAALAHDAGGLPLGPLTWRQALALYAAPGVVWAVVFWLVVPRPDDAPARPADRGPTPWRRLGTDPHLLLLCGQQFLRAGATALFFTWFPRYLQETKGVTVAESGSLAAWPLVTGMAGGLLGGAVSDFVLARTGRERLARQGLAVASMVVCAAVAAAASRVADPTAAVALVCVASFCGYVGGVSAYAVAMSMGGPRVAPVFATMNMSGNVGAALFPLAVGKLVAATGNWDATLLLFAAMYAGSGVCWALLNPKRPLFEDDPGTRDDAPAAISSAGCRTSSR